MKELPQHLILDNFYIWFDIKEKEEFTLRHYICMA